MNEPPRISPSPALILSADVEGFASLSELALDMRSSWNHATDQVWRQLDPELWDITHNPWVVLQTVSRDKKGRDREPWTFSGSPPMGGEAAEGTGFRGSRPAQRASRGPNEPSRNGAATGSSLSRNSTPRSVASCGDPTPTSASTATWYADSGYGCAHAECGSDGSIAAAI